MMRVWSGVLLAVLLASACHRDNPAYDGGTASETVDVPTSGTSADGTTRATDEGSASGKMTTTVGDSSQPTTEPDSDTEPNPQVCELEAPYDIVFSDPQLLAGCGITTALRVSVVHRVDEVLTARVCPAPCSCFINEASQTTLTFVGISLPEPLPECFELYVRQGAGEPSCRIEAYAIVPDEELPLVVVSNVLHAGLPGLPPFGFELAADPTTPPSCAGECEGEGGRPPGYYALSSLQNAGFTVPPDGDPVPFPPGVGTYAVRNEGSGLDGECEQVVRWHAVRE